MSDQTSTGPLSISMPTSGTKTAVPLVQDGQLAKYRFVSVAQTNNEKGAMLKLEWDLVDPVPNNEGGTIEPGKMGAKFFENIPLYGKDTPAGTIPEWATKRIAQRLDAMLGTGDPDNAKGKPARPDFNAQLIPTLTGKEVVAKMKIRNNDGYVSNDFGALYFPGDIQA